MKLLIAITISVFIFQGFSCKRVEKKAGELTNYAQSITKDFVIKANKMVNQSFKVDTFSIRDIVKDFQKDSSINEIRSIQLDVNLFYIEYCVYKANKDQVIKAVNNIVSKQKHDYSSDNKCRLTTKELFFKEVMLAEEKNEETKFFWDFQKLKRFEIYTCFKAPLRHYIIFDENSDTVYHRIEEIRD